MKVLKSSAKANVLVLGVSSDKKTVTGKAPPNTSVDVIKNDVVIGTVVANALGVWSYTAATAGVDSDIIKGRAPVTSKAVTFGSFGSGNSGGSTPTGPTVAGAPTLGPVTIGDARFTITSITPPTDNGGQAIVDYIIYAVQPDNNFKAIGTYTPAQIASPILVTKYLNNSPIVNGTVIKIVVAARNGVGGVSGEGPRSNVRTITPNAAGTYSINISPLNRQVVGGMSVETWRGRHLAMVSTDMPGASISVTDSRAQFSTQGVPGEAHVLQQWDIDVGAIGTKRSLTFTATADGIAPVTLTMDMETKPFVPTADRYEVFEYFDASTLTLDDANPTRVRKAVGKLRGLIREAPTGAGNPAGTNAPTVESGKGIRLSRASAQFMKMAPDAINDQWKALVSPQNPKFSHVVFYIPNSFTGVNYTYFSYVDSADSYKIAVRTNPANGGMDLFFGGGSANGANLGGIAPNVPSELQTGKLAYLALTTNGYIAWGDINNNRPEGGVDVNKLSNAPIPARTISDCYLGRLNAASGQYADGIMVAELIAWDDVCMSELRGYYESLRARMPGLAMAVVPQPKEVIDLTQVEPIPYFRGTEQSWALAPGYVEDISKPDTPWSISHAGNNRLGTIPANDTENAYHLNPNHDQYKAAGLDLQVVKPGIVLELKAKPLAQSGLPQATQDYIKSISANLTHVGAYRHTKNTATIMYGMTEGCFQLPLFRIGNFACPSWDLNNGGGHPPETDDMEQGGAFPGISAGVHAAPRHPRMGTRMARSRVGFASSHPEKEFHSYQVVKDAERDVWKYYMDGILHYSQEAQKGLKEDSVLAWRTALKANTISRGAGIVADNGTQTGTIRLSLTNATQKAPAVFTGIVTAGELVDILWDTEALPTGYTLVSGSQTFTPGMYNDNGTLTLKKGSQAAITATTLPDISLVQVGVNDPIFYDFFHTDMCKISNMALGIPSFAGTPTADQVATLKMSQLNLHRMKRTAANITTAVQSRADAHCTDLFNAITARGVTVDTTDRNIINAAFAKMMGAVRRWDRPMDGAQPKWDMSLNTEFDGLGQLMMFIGPYSDLTDWKNPSVRGVAYGAPVRAASKGFTFDGRSGGGQYVDFVTNMKTNNALANLMRDYENAFSLMITEDNTLATDDLLPIAGAGASYALLMAGANKVRTVATKDISTDVVVQVANRFGIQMGNTGTLVNELAEVALSPALYTFSKREHQLNVYRNGAPRRPHYSAYYGGRDLSTGHTSAVIPTDSFKIGSHSAGVTGAKASVGMASLHRWHSGEAHAFARECFLPLFQRYGVPNQAA